MRVGVQFPSAATGATDLREFVQEVESLGFDSVWMGDHVVLPERIADQSTYPYMWRFPEGTQLFPNKSYLEAVATAGFTAGVSSRLRIGVGVFVLPMRNPVLFAKQVATLDATSGGRIVVGVGAGWLREEFAALGVPYEQRGRRLDESLALVRQLWSGEPVTFDGEFFRLEDPMYCLPRPVQEPRLPLWFGGHTDRAFRRLVRHGDGWQAIELPPEDFAEHSRRLDELLIAGGRDPAEISRSACLRLPLGSADDAEVRARLAAFARAGCDELVVYVTPRRSIEENLVRFRRLATLRG